MHRLPPRQITDLVPAERAVRHDIIMLRRRRLEKRPEFYPEDLPLLGNALSDRHALLG